MRTGHGGRYRRPHLSRAWRWPRSCARAAGACTGWARPAAWKAGWCRRRALRWRRSTFPVCAARAWSRWRLLPLRLLRAFWQSLQVVRRVKPDVVVGLGGYITFPGGMMGVLLGKPLVLHEQNSVAGMANKVLAVWPTACSPRSPKRAEEGPVGGQPAARGLPAQPGPPSALPGAAARCACWWWVAAWARKALNDVVPQALALIPASSAPWSRTKAAPRRSTSCAPTTARGVQAELTPFIDDTAQRLRRGRSGDLPRRRQHRDRDCRRGCARRVRAVPVRGGRPPDHQRASW
jgi:hypothetical protein